MGVAAAIAGAAVVGAGASMISGNKAAKAQKDAAAQAAQASQAATDAQVAEARREYDTTRADLAPYRDTGGAALTRLAGMYGVGPAVDPTAAVEATPGYQFRMDQGLQAIQRSAAARGALTSGGTLKAITRYAQGTASDEFNNYSNRLAALAGVGQSAVGAGAASGANSSGQIISAIGQNAATQGSAAMAAGNARASSYANAGSAISGGVNNLASMYLYGGFGSGGGTVPTVALPYGGSVGGGVYR